MKRCETSPIPFSRLRRNVVTCAAIGANARSVLTTHAAPEGQTSGDCSEATSHYETWAVDFAHDQLRTGRKLGILTARANSNVDKSWAQRREHPAGGAQRNRRQDGDRPSEAARRRIKPDRIWRGSRSGRPASGDPKPPSGSRTDHPIRDRYPSGQKIVDAFRGKKRRWRIAWISVIGNSVVPAVFAKRNSRKGQNDGFGARRRPYREWVLCAAVSDARR